MLKRPKSKDIEPEGNGLSECEAQKNAHEINCEYEKKEGKFLSISYLCPWFIHQNYILFNSNSF